MLIRRIARQIISIRAGIVCSLKLEPDSDYEAEIIGEEIHMESEQIRTHILEIIREAADEIVALEVADIIVAGGRGLGKAENFNYVRELAEASGVTVGSPPAAFMASPLAPG